MLLVSSTLECAITEVQVNWKSVKPNGTLRILAHAEEVNLPGEKRSTIKNRQ